MRIVIDCSVLDRAITGTGRYLLNILEELPIQDKHNEYLLFATIEPDVDKSFYRIVLSKPSLFPAKINSPIWLNFTLPQMIKKYKGDLLFAPNILLPVVDLNGIKCVSVIHDVIPIIYKEYYPYFYKKYLSLFLPRSLRRSDNIITVSEQSKKDIIKFYNIPSHKIVVAHNTASHTFKPRNLSDGIYPEIIERLSLPVKFLLYVGVIESRKNILGIISILDIVREQGSKLELVMIGKPGYGSDKIIPEIQKRKQFIKYFKYLDDKALAYIYNLAFAFIFPSYYEGFGIPPLEAMQSGIPVLSSNTSALTEVVGDGGMLHSPEDHMGFAKDILKLENDKNYYSLMKLKALNQAKKFNVSETTQKIINIFDELNSDL